MTEAMQGNWVYGRANSVKNSSFGTNVRPYYIENIQECNTTSILRYGQPRLSMTFHVSGTKIILKGNVFNQLH